MIKENNQDLKDTLVPKSISIYTGNTAKLKLEIEDEGIELVSIESLNLNIVDILGGFVIGKNAGETKIMTKLSIDNEIRIFVTDVIVKPGTITVTPDITSIRVGETVKLRTMVSKGTYKSVSYESSNLSTVTVKQEGIYGLVQGLAEGSAVITVSVNVGNSIEEELIYLNVEPAKVEKIPVSNPVDASDYTVEDHWKGSHVYFGVFEQDNNIQNGKEPILWRVLEVKDDTILLLSEYGLASKFYNDFYENVTWETSSIRKWLNSSFMDMAFTASEVKAIRSTKLKNKDNKKFESSGGNNTVDKVFLLSKKDVANTAYGFMKGYRNKSKTRMMTITEYALQEGYRNKNNGNTCWWLRSPGLTNQYASHVLTSGNVTDSHFVGRRNDGVRPAIMLDRSSIIFGEEIREGKNSYPRIIAKD